MLRGVAISTCGWAQEGTLSQQRSTKRTVENIPLLLALETGVIFDFNCINTINIVNVINIP